MTDPLTALLVLLLGWLGGTVATWAAFGRRRATAPRPGDERCADCRQPIALVGPGVEYRSGVRCWRCLAQRRKSGQIPE